MSFSSSTLTKLCINLTDFYECLALLDGRLKQLTTFIVQVGFIRNRISTSHKMVSVIIVFTIEDLIISTMNNEIFILIINK